MQERLVLVLILQRLVFVISKMSTRHIASDVAKETGLTADMAYSVVTAVLNSIAKHLVKGNVVGVRGFGAFKVVHKPKRAYFNPSSLKWEMTEPKDKVVFKPSKHLLNPPY